MLSTCFVLLYGLQYMRHVNRIGCLESALHRYTRSLEEFMPKQLCLTLWRAFADRDGADQDAAAVLLEMQWTLDEVRCTNLEVWFGTILGATMHVHL